MINGPDITIQQYAYRAIRAAIPSTIPVETRPRNGGPLPYVFLGESDIREHEIGFEIRFTVDVWSEKEGPIQCKQLQHAVRNALHGTQDAEVEEVNEVSIDDTALTADSAIYPAGYSGRWRFMLIAEESASAQLEAGNSVWHGLQRFRLLAEEIE